MGSKWSKISKEFHETRNENMVKNRFLSLMKNKKAKVAESTDLIQRKIVQIRSTLPNSIESEEFSS